MHYVDENPLRKYSVLTKKLGKILHYWSENERALEGIETEFCALIDLAQRKEGYPMGGGYKKKGLRKEFKKRYINRSNTET